jgi:hypothetical protein
MQVEYHSIALTPGILYFDCQHLKARLSTGSCASMWRASNGPGCGDQARESCKRCPLGALHAGEADASTSSLAGSKVCSRCHRPAPRLIGGMHCVSCKNREYEFMKGKNAKGTTPVKLACLARRRIRFMAGGELRTSTAPFTLDDAELIISALRDNKSVVRFGLAPCVTPALRQMRLF